MKSILRNLFRAAIRLPVVGNLMVKTARKINSELQSDVDERVQSIYQRYQKFTRIPSPAYASNLNVLAMTTIPAGCVVECGTWRGGMSAGMADLLGADRTYYLFDSFEGLPDAKMVDGQKAIDWQSENNVDNCRTEEHYAQEVMAKSIAEKFYIVKGWFSDTLEKFTPDSPIAVLRLDADWYSSTAECINRLYPLVPKGGIILIDDYFAWDGCARAIHDYLSVNSISDRIRTVDNALAYIIRSDMRELKPIDPSKELT